MDKFEFPVTVYGNLERYNDVMSKARCRIFYKYGNRNGTYITDEFADLLLGTIAYAPVKGIFDGEDFTDHGGSRALGRIYGIVPENPNLAWENHVDEDGVERTYACVDVLLFTALYDEAKDIVGKPQSMEIYDKSIEGDWQMIEGRRYFVFKKGCFLGLQALGDEVEPCFEGAAFFTLYESITEMLNKIEKFTLNSQNNRQGGTKMPKFNFKLSDDTKFDMLWSLLNPNYNEESNWTIDYLISDVFDAYAIAFSCKKKRYERAYYTKDDEKDTVTIDKMEVCYIIDVTEAEKIALDTIQKLNNGNYEKADEVFTVGVNAASEAEKAKNEFDTKITELNNSISTLTTERDNAQSQFDNANTLLTEAQTALEEAKNSLATLEQEKQALVSYKEGVEKAEKEAVIASYAEMLSEEILNSFKENMDSYSAEDLDKELAYALKKNNPSVFSKNPNPQYVPKDTPKGGIEEVLEKYRK